MSKQKLSVVHDRDLESLLEQLGIASAVRRGEARCALCGTAVTKENLGALYFESGQVRVLCDEVGCLDLHRAHMKED